MTIVYTLLLFFFGSLMFSHWIGLVLKKDLRKLNDGNPGAANLWRSAGPGWGLLGIVFDFMKGYLPLAVLIWTGTLTGYALTSAAIAPVLGHAFSPFLKFRGGKCIAVSFGVWSALTNFEVSVAYALILGLVEIPVRLLRKEKKHDRRIDACKTVGGMFLLGGYLMFRAFSTPIILLWFLNLLLFIIVNRAMLLETHRSAFNRDIDRLNNRSDSISF